VLREQIAHRLRGFQLQRQHALSRNHPEEHLHALLELFQPGEAFAHPSRDPALQQFVPSQRLSGIRSAFVRSAPLLHSPRFPPSMSANTTNNMT